MNEKISAVLSEAKDQLAAACEQKAIEEIRVKYLGKKGELTGILKQLGSLSPEERPKVGQLVNKAKVELEELIKQKVNQIKEEQLLKSLQEEKIDVTMPGKRTNMGMKHPLSVVLDELKEIFMGMGYSIADGPEVELDYYNFEALNLPKDHPARDTQDTFYISENVLLRTQTSPVQVRVMEKQKPPIRIIAPGRVYRSDEVDANHSPLFHQIEGLVVDKNITMGDLKGALITIMNRIYGHDTNVRFRPHHFPFTEPSCEMDMQCHKCHGTGEVDGQVCSTCHGEGWIELLGAGMVHPQVLENCGIDSTKYSGFAFGMGLERMAMGRLKITDLRLIFDNDVRFLNQF